MRTGLLEMSFGEVHTYGELAKRLSTSPRAIGQARGANPLPQTAWAVLPAAWSGRSCCLILNAGFAPCCNVVFHKLN
jgi:hypothetical protein